MSRKTKHITTTRTEKFFDNITVNINKGFVTTKENFILQFLQLNKPKYKHNLLEPCYLELQVDIISLCT